MVLPLIVYQSLNLVALILVLLDDSQDLMVEQVVEHSICGTDKQVSLLQLDRVLI